jgi:hypothetical protein
MSFRNQRSAISIQPCHRLRLQSKNRFLASLGMTLRSG